MKKVKITALILGVSGVVSIVGAIIADSYYKPHFAFSQVVMTSDRNDKDQRCTGAIKTSFLNLYWITNRVCDGDVELGAWMHAQDGDIIRFGSQIYSVWTESCDGYYTPVYYTRTTVDPADLRIDATRELPLNSPRREYGNYVWLFQHLESWYKTHKNPRLDPARCDHGYRTEQKR